MENPFMIYTASGSYSNPPVNADPAVFSNFNNSDYSRIENTKYFVQDQNNPNNPNTPQRIFEDLPSASNEFSISTNNVENIGNESAPLAVSQPVQTQQSSRTSDKRSFTPVSLNFEKGNKKSFINYFSPYAERIAKESGLNKDFIIAQAGLETGWGKSMHDFNFGNITAGKYYTGKTRVRGDKDGKGNAITQTFRSYDNMDDAVNDYVKFMNLKRYRRLKGLNAIDAANEISSTGYATDPKYSELLKQILSTLYK